MTTNFLQDGRTFKTIDMESVQVHETLPPGTYGILVSPAGYYLERVENMDLPPKVYGDVAETADRIFKTFEARPAATGVLLAGNKGSGKTMLTKFLSQMARDNNMITILINSPLCGEAFNQFLQSIAQPAIVIFDEFEKVYDAEQQKSLLTIFDGTYSSKKLFLLTVNDSYRVDSYMHNRPGRIYYSLQYAGLSPAFIREYCQDCLNDKGQINGVLTVASLFTEFSFDMLQALVEEMNRWSEPASKAMTMLNLKPQMDMQGATFEIELYKDGRKVDVFDSSPDHLIRNPLIYNDFDITFYKFDEDDEDDVAEAKKVPNPLSETLTLKLDRANLVSADALAGEFVFSTARDGVFMKFKRKVAKPLDYEHLF